MTFSWSRATTLAYDYIATVVPFFTFSSEWVFSDDQILAKGSCGEKELVSSVCGWLLVGGGVIAPVVTMTLPLDVAPSMTRFRGAIIDLKEAF